MISETIRNMGATLAAHGEVKPEVMPTVLELLADIASQVEKLEMHTIPPGARVIAADLAPGGNVVPLRRRQ